MKRKNIVLIILLSLLLMMSIKIQVQAESSASDLVYANVNNNSLQEGEELVVEIKLKAPDGKEFYDVHVDVCCNGTIQYKGTSTLNYYNDYKEAVIEVKRDTSFNAGTWQVFYIYVWYADGSNALYYDPSMTNYRSYEADEYICIKLPSIEVIKGELQKDTTCPKVDTSTLQISTTHPKLGDWVYISIKATDDSGELDGYVEYDGEIINGSFSYDEENHVVEVGICLEKSIHYEFKYFCINDMSGNCTMIINTAYSKYENLVSQFEPQDNIKLILLNLPSFSFDINNNYIEPYTVNCSKTYIEKNKVTRFEDTIVKVSINNYDDNYNIDVYCSYDLINKKISSSIQSAFICNDPDTGKCCYGFNINSGMYGKIVLTSIVTSYKGYNYFYIDINHKDTIDYSFISHNNHDYIEYVDLSNYVIEVVAKDGGTGISVYNDVMDDDVVLEVEVLDENDENYDTLHNEEDTTIGYYDVNVEGNYSDEEHPEARVDFPVDEEYGTELTIKHLQEDGTIEEEQVVVEDGVVSMEVTGFSPFMIEKKVTNPKKEINIDVDTKQNSYYILVIGCTTVVLTGVILLVKKRKKVK